MNKSMSIYNYIKTCTQVQGLSAFFVMMTPHIAKNLLEANTKNRALRAANVKKYATEMSMGEWMLVASGIGFDSNGVLLDGQHRLEAIVQSGATVPMLVVLGLAPKSQKKVDRQAKRTMYDALRLSDIEISRKGAQIANYLALIAKTGATSWGKYPCDAEVEAAYDCHQEAILAITSICPKNNKGVGRAGFISAVVLYYEIDKEKALHFFDLVLTGTMMTLDDPPMRLRRYLLGEVASKRNGKGYQGGSGQHEDFRKTVYAINAFHTGRKICKLMEASDFDFKPSYF